MLRLLKTICFPQAWRFLARAEPLYRLRARKTSPEAEDDEPGVQIRDAGFPAYLDAGIRPAVGVGIYLGGEQALNGFPYIYDGRRSSSQTFLFAESHSNNILYLSCVTGSCNYTSL